MLFLNEFSEVIWPVEVFVLCILNLFRHVVLQALGELVDDLLQNVVQLHNLTSVRSEVCLFGVVSMVLEQILLQNLY